MVERLRIRERAESGGRARAVLRSAVERMRRHLAGEIGIEQASEGAKMDTRRYTKRQATWFRNQMPGWTWVPPERAEAEVLALISA